jgi:hypothetical protein
MATIRRAGFGTVFELEDSKVGIGTDAATHTLQALGNIRSEAATDIGISSLTTYQGFVDKEARFTTGQIDNQSQSGSTSGEIVIDGDVTVSSATTFTSGSQHLSVTDTFTLPSGDTNSRALKPTVGSLRFNQDFATLEFYTGNNWATVNTFTEIQNSPGNRGRAFNLGGGKRNSPYYISRIEFINVQSKGNSINFGDFTNSRGDRSGLANEIRGIAGGGNPSQNNVEYITMASEGDAIDFGDLTQSRLRGSAASSSTRGIFIGGRNPGNTNVMDYIEIMTLGDALDFGDLLTSGTRGSGTGSSATRVIIANKEIDFITIASKGNSVEFGKDLFVGQYHQGGGSTGTRAMWAGGYSGPATSPYGVEMKTTSIRGVNIESGGVATEYGNLTPNRGSTGAAYNYNSGTSDKTRAVWMGGYQLDPNQYVNNIDFFTMNSTGNAQDFGDLTEGIALNTTCCDSHGGLGGI